MTLKSGSYSSELSIPGTKEVQTHANTEARQKKRAPNIKIRVASLLGAVVKHYFKKTPAMS